MQVRDFGALTSCSGPACTIHGIGDNALIKSMLASPGRGAVLVFAGGGLLATALMGDMTADSAVENGWAGVIIHGAIRDSVTMGTLQLGVKALGTDPAKSSKSGTGSVDVPIQIGDVTVHPGAKVHADPDGILVTLDPWDTASSRRKSPPAVTLRRW